VDTKVKIETPVQGNDKEPWNGIADYCMFRENGAQPGHVRVTSSIIIKGEKGVQTHIRFVNARPQSGIQS
jgi:hypothetical protein